jgi:GTP:adenosylcobinamide-phosphate guanylyltransferase
MSDVAVFAHGLGSRLAPVATRPHKTSESVGGEPILSRLIREVRMARPDARLTVFLRREDDTVNRVLRQFPEVKSDVYYRQPSGYLQDVFHCRERMDDHFSVLEGDAISPSGSIRNFLLLAQRLEREADVLVGVAPQTVTHEYDVPSVSIGSDGYITGIGRGLERTGLMPVAAWHWRSSVLEDASQFLAEHSSVSRYVNWLIQQGARVIPIGIPAIHNVNTPADLRKAERGVAMWRGAYPDDVRIEREDVE